MGSFIEFDQVCKYYTMGEQRITAADQVSFNIEEGEFTIIAGPSGAGKTYGFEYAGAEWMPVIPA